MSKYIAFLRAINVGGTSIIKMIDLKKMLESFGLENVETYIQSGNVIFDSDEKNASTLEEQIEHQLEIARGKRIQLFVRTIRQVTAMAKDCPFDPKGEETAYVTILDQKPDKKHVEALMAFRNEVDDFFVKGTEAYHLRRSREKSIFANRSAEKVLGVPGTARNMTVIKKLVEKYG